MRVVHATSVFLHISRKQTVLQNTITTTFCILSIYKSYKLWYTVNEGVESILLITFHAPAYPGIIPGRKNKPAKEIKL